MTDGGQRDTEAYLARIRRTIEESERMVESVKLRIAETDRMLEKQGLTREQVMRFSFSPEQREAVNRELARRGLEPLGDEMEDGSSEVPTFGASNGSPTFGSAFSPNLETSTSDGELAERQRKFGMMMKPFQI